jgi:hypothetical protein
MRQMGGAYTRFETEDGAALVEARFEAIETHPIRCGQSTSDTAVYLSSEEVVGTGSVAYGYSGIEGAKRLVGMFIMDYVDRCT